MDRHKYWINLLQEARAERWSQGLDQPASDWSLLNIVAPRAAGSVPDPEFEAAWLRALTAIHADMTPVPPSPPDSTELFADDLDVPRQRLERLDGFLREFGAIDSKTGGRKMRALALYYFDELDWQKIAVICKCTPDEARRDVDLCLQWLGLKAGV